MWELGFSKFIELKDDYTANSHYLTYTFLSKRLGECTLNLNLGVKGLVWMNWVFEEQFVSDLPCGQAWMRWYHRFDHVRSILGSKHLQVCESRERLVILRSTSFMKFLNTQVTFYPFEILPWLRPTLSHWSTAKSRMAGQTKKIYFRLMLKHKGGRKKVFCKYCQPTVVIRCSTAPSHTFVKGASRMTPDGGAPENTRAN